MVDKRETKTLIILAAFIALSTAPGAQAKLGQNAFEFKSKSARAFKFKSETKKDDRIYWMFSMMLDAQT
ncbi:MAG: hypothetical protein ACRD3W_31140, partial [Terriglobales bacterium]